MDVEFARLSKEIKVPEGIKQPEAKPPVPEEEGSVPQREDTPPPEERELGADEDDDLR